MLCEQAHQLFKRNEAYLLFAAQTVKPIERRIDRNDTDHASSLFFELANNIGALVFELHERMFCIEHHEGKKGQDMLHENGSALLRLAGREVGGAQNLDTVGGKIFPKGVIAGGAHLIQLCSDLRDPVQLFCRRKLRLVLRRIGLRQALIDKTSYAHHEKFIKVGRENR